MDERLSRCAECCRQLAHDQRYCLRCGARRGPLPPRIGLTIGEIHERGRRLPRSGAELSAPASASASIAEPAGEPEPARDLVGTARSAAVAILLMIAFGCVVGSLTVPGGVTGLARAIVVSVAPSQAAPAPTTANDVSGDAGSSTSTAAAPAQTQAAAPASAPTVTQRTVTVGAAPTDAGGDSSTSSTTTSSPTSLLGLPPIRHVWLIVLSQQGYQQSFATATGHPYLARTLRRQGELIADYYGVAASPLANELALLSGQGPTPQTLGGCPEFDDLRPGTLGHFNQASGTGCLYPQSVLTLPDQLDQAGLGWRTYVEGIGEKLPPQTSSTTTTTTPTTTTTTTSTSTGTTSPTAPLTVPGVTPNAPCPHPPFNQADQYQTATPAAPYVTWRNPVVFFRTVLIGGHCTHDDVGLPQLTGDLKSAAGTPAFSLISPGPCDDGSDTPCAPGAPAGLSQADRFLTTVVPEIEHSPAYRQDGLIAITFDGAPSSGPHGDITSCCDQPVFPNLPKPTTTSTTSSTTTSSTTTSPCSSSTSSGTTSTFTTPTSTTSTTPTDTCTPTLPPGTNPGGGQVGLLLISRYIKPNSSDLVDTFNHFSLLKTIEDLFGLRPLGYGRDSALPVFDAAIFNGNPR